MGLQSTKAKHPAVLVRQAKLHGSNISTRITPQPSALDFAGNLNWSYVKNSDQSPAATFYTPATSAVTFFAEP